MNNPRLITLSITLQRYGGYQDVEALVSALAVSGGNNCCRRVYKQGEPLFPSCRARIGIFLENILSGDFLPVYCGLAANGQKLKVVFAERGGKNYQPLPGLKEVSNQVLYHLRKLGGEEYWLTGHVNPYFERDTDMLVPDAKTVVIAADTLVCWAARPHILRFWDGLVVPVPA